MKATLWPRGSRYRNRFTCEAEMSRETVTGSCAGDQPYIGHFCQVLTKRPDADALIWSDQDGSFQDVDGNNVATSLHLLVKLYSNTSIETELPAGTMFDQAGHKLFLDYKDADLSRYTFSGAPPVMSSRWWRFWTYVWGWGRQKVEE